MAVKKLSHECLQNIFNNIENSNSLFSALLVNKNWCNNVVITLWKNPFRHDIELTKMEKIIPVLLSPITSQQRIELNLQNIPIKTTFEYGWFIQQIDIITLFRLVYLWLYPEILDPEEFKKVEPVEKCVLLISKMIFMKTKGLEELNFSSGIHEDLNWRYFYLNGNTYKQIITLVKSQMLLDQVARMKFDNRLFSPLLELSNCTKNIKHLSIKFVSYYGLSADKAECYFKDLIELISVQQNLEYFDLSIVIHEFSVHYNKGMPKWEQLFLTISEYSSHSIKYLKFKSSFIQESINLNFLSYCSNLEELHLDDVIFEFDQMECLKKIYLPKLFSLSLLDCFVRSKGVKSKWVILILDFLKNHGSTLKELMLVLNTCNCHEYRVNGYEPVFNTISLYCVNLILLGLNLDHIFGYDRYYEYYYNDIEEREKQIYKFKSFCNNCPKLQKIILFASDEYTYKLPNEFISKFLQILPNSIKFLSLEGNIDIDLLNRQYNFSNLFLVSLDFYCNYNISLVKSVVESINKEKKRKASLKFGMKIKSIYLIKCFLDFS